MKQAKANSSFAQDDDDDDEPTQGGGGGVVDVYGVSWYRQLSFVLYKNILLLSRRPLQVILMLLSSIGSVLLASLAVDNNNNATDKYLDFGNVTLTSCGTIDGEYLSSLAENDPDAMVPLSYNESWRNGFAVTVMACGPLIHAIVVFLTVQTEIQTQMLGILRGAGLRESVFWMSWWIPFLLTAFCNSFFGTITASLLSIHALQHIYFLGIFASFFFLNLALMGASFFLASVCGTARGGAATWCMILLIVAAWIPLLVQTAQSYVVHTPSDLEYSESTPVGLFWVPRSTAVTGGTRVDGVEGDCELPIVGKSQGNIFLTVETQATSFPDDQFFVGCYFGAGYVNSAWNQDKKAGIAVLFMFPYVHFAGIWANFLGYTAMPGRAFSSEQAWWTSEKLAVESLPSPPDPSLGYDSVLFAQSSTLNTNVDYYVNTFGEDGSRLTNCPSPDMRDYFCANFPSARCIAAVEHSPTSSPSVMNLYGFLFLLSILYTLLASYWTQVFPGKNGAPRKFYFFLLPSYWTGRRRSKSSSSKHLSSGVQVKDVSKKYGRHEALKDVTISLESGEVTGLLGHNGAGKSSLSSILSCEIPPTSGDVSIFGYSVKEETDMVRQLVAVCKQDDYLYPTLTAYEHLELFAGLKGVDFDQITQVVEKWLASVDLLGFQDHYSSSFSGGMKRRLSLACATIGSRPLVILDEPTTGMDPVSRRYVWKHIDLIKKDRVVLLTTHAMEEADLLADSVAVMRRGSLAAFGTPLELKSRYGSAMQFSLLVKPYHVRPTERAITRHFREFLKYIAVEAGDAGNITVKISSINTKGSPGVDVEVLSEFVSWLENKDISCITEYGFSNSSLEEVFLAVTEAEDEEQRIHDECDEYNVCCSGCSKSCILCCLRGPCSCCCCSRRRPKEDDVAVETTTAFKNGAVLSFSPVLSSWRQARAVLYFSVARNWLGKSSKASWIFHLAFIGGAVLLMLRSNNSGLVAPFLVAPTMFLSLGLISFVSPIYRDRNNGVFYLVRAQGLLKNGYLFGAGMYTVIIQFIYGLCLLSLVFLVGPFGEPEICSITDTETWTPCFGENWSATRVSNAVRLSLWQDTFNNEEVELYATWKGGGYINMLGIAVAFALTMPGAVFSSAYVPGFKFAVTFVIVATLVSSVAPIIAFFLLGSEDGHEQCLSNICDVSESLFSTGELSSRELLNCAGLQVNLGVVGSLCMPAKTALLPQFGLFQMLSMTVISEITFVSNPPEYVEEVLIPSLGKDVQCSGRSCKFPYAEEVFRANFGFTLLGGFLLLFLGVCLVSFFSFPGKWVIRVKHFLVGLWKLVTLQGKPQEQKNTAQQSSPPFEEVTKESEYVSSIFRDITERSGSEEDGEYFQGVRLEDSHRDQLPPVLTYKLGKVYPSLGGRPPKVALRSLDFHVEKGQVLGLLGKNGAGKTSAVKILAGAHEATSGLAIVAGYDIADEQMSVFERLGNCQQFDVVWPGQTVKRHLEFFGMLKGLPKAKVQAVALSIAKNVGLGSPEVYNRQAQHLSGGMRRRLSIAIALIGSPNVLLLDEPTTGLDPSTRNSIWNLVSSFSTKERAIIITTHMMEEADTLCNRIAIMSSGELKVIATQQALKDKFGSGYLLQLNLVKSTKRHQSKALDFVRRNIHKDATLQSRQAKTLRVAVPKDIDLAHVFRVLYSHHTAKEGCINQFLLSQSSLEDVFLALGD